MYAKESHVMRVLDRFARTPDASLAKGGEAHLLLANFRAWRFPRFAVRRELVPLVFSLLGCSYVVWESQVADHYSLVSFSALVGLGLFGVAAPLLALTLLTWAEHTTSEYGRAGHGRVLQRSEARENDRATEWLAAKEELGRRAEALRQVLIEERRIEERTRAHIARDLHDGVQQLIIGTLFETQAAREAIAEHPDTALQRLDSAQELLHRIEKEMRSAIYNLRPVALDAHGLVPALRECAESFASISQVTCDLRVEGTPRRFNADAEVAVFRIVQESLNNIEAHAQAKSCRICVTWGARNLKVEIADDGRGFDMARAMRQARAHLGLIGMRERAEGIDGVVQIWSRVGEGTRINLSVPLQ
jgi:signal transduction histidine kinase